MSEPRAEPETFVRVSIRAERNGFIVRGEHPTGKRPDDRETPCWLAADRDELADLVRRLMAEPPEGRAP